MRILPINNYGNTKVEDLSFKRKLTSLEYKHYVPIIMEGLAVLNKELGLIIHNSSVPSAKGTNLGIGSLLSKVARSAFIPFLAGHGFSSIQQEPNYIRRTSDPSPYDPLSTSKNIYMIPLESLASEHYGNMLNQETINGVLATNSEKVDYASVNENFEKEVDIVFIDMEKDDIYNIADYRNTYGQITMYRQTVLALKKDFEIFSFEKASSSAL